LACGDNIDEVGARAAAAIDAPLEDQWRHTLIIGVKGFFSLCNTQEQLASFGAFESNVAGLLKEGV
jgi:hypothetical protein